MQYAQSYPKLPKQNRLVLYQEAKTIIIMILQIIDQHTRATCSETQNRKLGKYPKQKFQHSVSYQKVNGIMRNYKAPKGSTLYYQRLT